MNTYVIDGNNFCDLDSFYDEIESVFTKDINFKIGKNLDALSDVLSGGFNRHEYGEEIKIIWLNSSKSKIDLSKETFDKIIKTIKENKQIDLIIK